MATRSYAMNVIITKRAFELKKELDKKGIFSFKYEKKLNGNGMMVDSDNVDFNANYFYAVNMKNGTCSNLMVR